MDLNKHTYSCKTSFQVEPKNSKTWPLLVTICGSDAKEHKYLVKFGEDLRQDQRIEQLFNLMNKILDLDLACRHGNLSITTYQVLSRVYLILRILVFWVVMPSSRVIDF
jgi:DNA-dependent protein kinase catalytic subunit